MKIKEYKLYKTAKKTAKENNLEYVDSFETGERIVSKGGYTIWKIRN